MAKRPKVSLLKFTFLSKYIGRQQNVNVLLPYGCYSSAKPAKQPYKVLWCLHGKSDDFDTWMRNSIIETVARENDFAVIMPDAGNSFYTDMKYGPDYFSYITEEVPELLYNLLPLSKKKEDNFIAGLSMGGYGAFKIGLTYPERFAALCCMSSAVDIAFTEKSFENNSLHLNDDDYSSSRSEAKLCYSIFGEELGHLKGTKHDIYYLIDEANKNSSQPPIFMGCGTEDEIPLYPDNEKFANYCKEKGYDVTFVPGPGGHNWNVWNRDIAAFISYLKERNLIKEEE